MNINEIHLELLRLEGDYARTWDTGDAQGWADLFTDEGVFEMAAVGEMAAAFIQGRAALEQFCRTIDASYQGLHLIHTPSFRIEAEQARGWIHFEFRAQHQGAPVYVMGVYQVLYRRTARGWKIQHRFEQAVQDKETFYAIPAVRQLAP